MKTLLVMRHAKAEPAENERSDHERKLTSRGRQDAARMAALLRERGLVPDAVISSSAARALETANIVCERAGFSGAVELCRELYLAPPRVYLDALRQLSIPGARVLIVGHNPGVEELLVGLSGTAETLPTASVIELAVPISEWSQVRLDARAEVVNLWRPKELD